MPTTGAAKPMPGCRAVEPGITEGETPAVGSGLPVALAVRRCCDAHHRCRQPMPGCRAVEPASPKANTPPSAAASSSPGRQALLRLPTTGAARRVRHGAVEACCAIGADTPSARTKTYPVPAEEGAGAARAPFETTGSTTAAVKP